MQNLDLNYNSEYIIWYPQHCNETHMFEMKSIASKLLLRLNCLSSLDESQTVTYLLPGAFVYAT